MPSSGLLSRVALVRTDVSEERGASIITVKTIGKARTLAVTSKRQSVVSRSLIPVTLMMEALRSSETTVHKKATRRNIPEYGILHSHRRESLKFYKPGICYKNQPVNAI
jgi:hypothetical protein